MWFFIFADKIIKLPHFLKSGGGGDINFCLYKYIPRALPIPGGDILNPLNPAHTSVNILFLKTFPGKTFKCLIWYYVTPSKIRILSRVLVCPSLGLWPMSQKPLEWEAPTSMGRAFCFSPRFSVMGISPNRKDIIIDIFKKIIIYSTVELASSSAWTERRVCGVEEIRLQEEARALVTKEGLSVGKGIHISWDGKWGATDGLEEGNDMSDLCFSKIHLSEEWK